MHTVQSKDTVLYNREMCRKYNNISFYDKKAIDEWLHKMFDLQDGKDVTIRPPFVCNDGKKIHFKGTAFFNAYCMIEHRVDVYIGDNVRIAPRVTIAGTNHAIDPQDRIDGIVDCEPVHIGDNVWIGSNSVILSGVSIGENTVIGAGSVVTKDIPANVVAFGNPCRVQRKIEK